MMDEFTIAEIQTDETSIFVRSYGSGPPLLLVHGFPQTHLMWRSVAPLLARNFTVVCADLRGYGCSGCPPSDELKAQVRERCLAMLLDRLGEQVRGKLYRNVLIYSILSANTYSPQCSDGHYHWCVANLSNQHYWNAIE